MVTRSVNDIGVTKIKPAPKKVVDRSTALWNKILRTVAIIFAGGAGWLANQAIVPKCASVSQFDPYVGPSKVQSKPKEPKLLVDDTIGQGYGGERVWRNGVSFWTSGEPPCKYEQLGRLTWAGSSSHDWMTAVSEKVKSVGGASLLLYEVSILPEQTSEPKPMSAITSMMGKITMSKDDTFGWSAEVRKIGGMVVRCVDPDMRAQHESNQGDASDNSGPWAALDLENGSGRVSRY